MDPPPTLDVLLNDPSTGKDRLTRAVESAAAAAPESAYQFDRPVAEAEPLQARVMVAIARAGPILGTDRLEYAVGKTLARLSLDLDGTEQSSRDVIEGRVTRFASVEEMRRELLRVPSGVH